MKRSGGRSRGGWRRGGKGRGRRFKGGSLGGVAMVALGIAIIFAVGYWARGTPVDKLFGAGETTQPQENTDSGGTAKPPAPIQVTPQQPPVTQTPVTQPQPKQPDPKPDASKAILEARSKIDRAGTAAQTMLVTVYYADGLKNVDTLQPVQVRVPFSRSVIQVTAEQVINAPSDLKLYSSVPPGTKVKSVNLRQGGVAVVDLSAEVSQVQGTAAVENLRASFVYSLTEISSVNAVQLWVNGRPAVLHGIEWSKPISRSQLEARNLFKVEPVIKYGSKS